MSKPITANFILSDNLYSIGTFTILEFSVKFKVLQAQGK